MSSVSELDHLNPNDPSYYAPRWSREKPEQRSSASRGMRSRIILTDAASIAASRDRPWHRLPRNPR